MTYAYVAFSTVMFLAFYGILFISSIPAAPLGPELGFACYVLYVVQLITSCCTDSTHFIKNQMDREECLKNIDTAIKNPPSVIFHIKNYHWENKTHKK